MPADEARAAERASSRDRAFVYRGLVGLFGEPGGERTERARLVGLADLEQGLSGLGAAPSLLDSARALRELVAEADAGRMRQAYLAAFDESSRCRCAPTEMDQLGGAPQLELTRTFEIADVAGFYRAFGVEVPEEGVRADHIAAELEFMHLLAVKEFVAHGEPDGEEHAAICRDASRAFLRDHLLRWAPRFGDALAASGGDAIYAAAGRLLAAFVPFDAALIDAEGAPSRPSRRDPATDGAELRR